jgi:nucleotide-binding universal stress UspA family protein
MQNLRRILLPLDTRRCPLEVFPLVSSFAKSPEVTLILLHVVTRDLAAAENRSCEELGRNAEWHLERLAEQYVPPIASTVIHVRIGQPAEQILAEARGENVDLILLPTFGPARWNRLTALWKPAACPAVSPLAQRIIREATCGVFLAMAKTRFDCEAAWGRPEGAYQAQAKLGRREPLLAHRPATLMPF